MGHMGFGLHNTEGIRRLRWLLHTSLEDKASGLYMSHREPTARRKVPARQNIMNK